MVPFISPPFFTFPFTGMFASGAQKKLFKSICRFSPWGHPGVRTGVRTSCTEGSRRSCGWEIVYLSGITMVSLRAPMDLEFYTEIHAQLFISIVTSVCEAIGPQSKRGLDLWLLGSCEKHCKYNQTQTFPTRTSPLKISSRGSRQPAPRSNLVLPSH